MKMGLDDENDYGKNDENKSTVQIARSAPP
jgi:hypothetical protein